MSDFRLNIPYMSLKNSNVLLFYVIWSLLSAALLFIFFKALDPFFHNMGWICLLAFAFLGGAPFVFVPYQVFVISKEGNRIYADRDHLYFSPLTCLGLGLHLTRRWSDLIFATVNCANPARLTHQDHLLLKFRHGGTAKLFLDRLSGDSCEQLLLAVDLLAGNCERSAELLAYQDYLQNENKGREGYSYT